MESLKTTNLSESRNDSNNMTYQFYANYGNKWGDHSFSAMVGYEGYKYEWENLGASRTNYLLDRYPYLNLGPEDYQYNSGSAGHNAYQSVFGRLMYSYRNKYMIQANIRTDGSSRFHKDCRWGTFPSVSAGWVISEEPWFKNDVLQYLKLRGSIGQLGNERIGSEFPYMAAISFGNSYMYDKGLADCQRRAERRTGILRIPRHNVGRQPPHTAWEPTCRSSTSACACRPTTTTKKTEDMLLTLGFPSYAGFSAPSQNAGDMYTKGWDLEIGWSDTIGDFSYSISANLSGLPLAHGIPRRPPHHLGNYITEEDPTIKSGTCTAPTASSLRTRISTMPRATNTPP